MEEPPVSGMRASLLFRVGAVLLAWMLGAWALVGIFLAPLLPGGWWLLLLAAALTTAPVGVLLRGFSSRSYPNASVRLVVMRPFWYAFLLLPLVALSGLVGALVGWPLGDALAGGQRAVLGVAAFLALFVIAGAIGSRALVVRRLEFAFRELPGELDGLRVVQLSDVHVGPHTSRWHLARIARAVEAARPDILVHTGDQVDDFAQDVAHFVRRLGHLQAPLGVFAVPGNHDIYAGWDAVRQGMEKAGIRVLVNDAVPVQKGGATLWVAGTGDPAATQMARLDPGAPAPDPERTMAKVPPGAFSLVLAHNPALWPGLAKRGASLTLSGHTHHGQISIPWLRWCLASPFLQHAMGTYRDGERALYINPGTNYWALPLRLGAWPEVTIVTLRRNDVPPRPS